MATSRPLAPEPELGSVLIVDDEAASRHLLGGYLAAVPCQVAEAVDGASALAAVAAAPPDLILLDVRMPGMNGLAVTRRLKTVPATATIPIMLVTALDDAADRLRGLEAGADDLSLSIRGPEGPIGVLGAYTARPRAFTADDIHFLQGIGQVLATAMDRTRAEADRAEILAQEQEVRRHLEEHNRALARAIEAKTDLVAAMSRKLRTTLNSIIGFSELLLDETADDPQAAPRHRFASHVHESGKQLLSLVNDLLALATIEAGRMELVSARVEVQAALQAVEAVIRPMAEQQGVALDSRVMSDVTAIHADEGKFQQVLYNLLSNAVKCTPAGKRVETTARLVEGAVEIVVADASSGIAPEDQERIFEPVAQLDRAAMQLAEGRELSLVLARQLVELHGGRIWVESSPGEGSRFGFTMPV